MSMSRAKTLCSVVHETTQHDLFEELVFNMSVKGSNGTARYVRHSRFGFYLEQKSNKDGTFVPLAGPSQLDIGTLSKVSFENANDIFFQHVVHALKQKKIYLWLIHENVMKGEFLYRVLKSSTTASDYAEMLRMNDEAATSAQTNPNLTKINKKGQPSRPIGVKYADIPIPCQDFAAYPASYVTPNPPPMPAPHCDAGTVQRAPDGTRWRVECPKGPTRTVCQWKVDRQGTYKKLEQHDDPGPGPGLGATYNGHVNDGEMHPLSVMDRVKAPGTIKVLVLCHPRPFAGHWQENVIRQHTEELFADRLKTGETLDFFTLDQIVSTHNTADFSMGNAPNLFQVTRFSSRQHFDMVWAPECGGEWYKMMQMEDEEQRERLRYLVETMSMSVKPGGYLMFGKLPFRTGGAMDAALALLWEAGFARVDLAAVPNLYVPEGDPLAYILVQTGR